MKMLVAMAVACLSVGVSAARESDETVRRYQLNIPQQGLGAALKELAEQTGLQVALLANAVDGQTVVGPVSGKLTAAEALASLLKEKGLKFRMVNEKTIAVVPANSTVRLDSEGNLARNLENCSGFSTDKLDLSPSLNRTGLEVEKGCTRRQYQGNLALARVEETEGVQPVQPNDGKSSLSSDLKSSVKVDEVIVTATRREERLQDAPISISVVSGDDLDRSFAKGVTEVLNRVPGVTTMSVDLSDQPAVSMRGASPSLGTSSTVGYYLDSVPFGLVGRSITPDMSAFDLERIEVVRGPQGTLYGANSQSGVVRVLTKDPNLNEFELKALTSISETKHGSESYQGDVAVNMPIVAGKLAARVVVGYDELGGWIDKPTDEDANDAQLQNLRLKLGFQPIEQLSIGLSTWISRADFGARSTSDGDRSVSLVDEPLGTDFDAYGLKVAYENSLFSISSVTAYLGYENENLIDLVPRGLPINTTLYENNKSSVFSQEINVISPRGEKWRWSGGVFYRDAEDRLTSSSAIFAVPADNTSASESFAVFGEITRSLFGGVVDITAGARHFIDDVSQHENVRHTGIPTEPLYRKSNTFTATSPRFVITWKPKDRLTAYGSYAEGFRSGFNQSAQVANIAPDFAPVNEDNLRNFEIGAKGRLFNDAVEYDTAVYYQDWSDIQQSLSVPYRGINISAFVNGESASGIGAELSVTTRPFSNMELGAGAGWNSLEMDSDVVSRGVVVFRKGERLAGSPKTTVSVFAKYEIPLHRHGLKASISASGNYISEQYFKLLSGSAVTTLQGDPMLIARTDFSLESQRWTGTIFVENLNNENGVAFKPTPVAEWWPRVRPRTIGVQLGYRF